MKHPLRSVIIIGATSGIGRAVTERLVAEGVRVGIAGRREDRLKEIQEQLGTERISYRVMDVTKASATVALDELIAEVGAPDALLYASGIGKQNPTLDADLLQRAREAAIAILSRDPQLEHPENRGLRTLRARHAGGRKFDFSMIS